MAGTDTVFPDSLARYCQSSDQAPRWWIALSGGLDSMVLLHALAAYARAHPAPPVTAIHIHHGLQPSADQWVTHCQQACAGEGVDCHVVRVHVDARGQGVEMAAREARYAAFADVLGDGEVLWMAHHLDDQAETVLMRLLRGSGPMGLAGMPVGRALAGARVVRPLLDTTRRELEAYAKAQGIDWVEDPSNASLVMDRNFLRHQLFPLLEGRWPAYRQAMARSAHWLREQSSVEQAALAVLLASRQAQDRYGQRLDITGVAGWPAGLRQALLRHWLHDLGLPMPSAAHLAALDHEVLCARVDACGQWTLGDKVFSRFRDGLYAHDAIQPAQAGDWCDVTQAFRMGPVMRLQASSGEGAGCLQVAAPWRVTYRQGGERCQPARRAHGQTLKHLMQEYAIPPWLRDVTPLLYAGDQLVAVADYWVCRGFEAGDGEKGWKIHWKIAVPN